MADYELIGLNEAAPDLRAPTSADRGIVVGGVRVSGLSELDGGADINGDPVATVSRTNPLRQAVRVAMTAAASGSTGIQVLDNANLDMGTNNFTLHWEGSLPDWTPAANARLAQKISAGSSPYTGWSLEVLTTGILSFALYRNDSGVGLNSTVSTGLADGSLAKISVVITRETARAAGSVVFYINGVQLGSAVSITSAATFDLSNANLAYFNGTSVARIACDFGQAIIYNRALSAAEVLSLCVNGPALADIGASQTPIYTSDFSAGADGWTTTGSATVTGNIDGINGQDDWLRVSAAGGANTANVLKNISPTVGIGKRCRIKLRVFLDAGNVTLSGVEVTARNAGGTGAAPTVGQYQIGAGNQLDIVYESPNFSDIFAQLRIIGINSSNVATATAGDLYYVKLVDITQIGITGQWNAENAQSNTGQIFDSSGNKNHALLPAAGATIIGKEMSVPKQVRWTNTWAGTNELQYIGGVNQAILPDKAYIDSIIGTVTGATPHDIIIGDGSDTDRYVTITTGLAAGTTTFTLANRTTDGTNLKLTVDPDTNSDMSIAWVISYRILE